jgi:hypothetical protein
VATFVAGARYFTNTIVESKAWVGCISGKRTTIVMIQDSKFSLRQLGLFKADEKHVAVLASTCMPAITTNELRADKILRRRRLQDDECSNRRI